MVREEQVSGHALIVAVSWDRCNELASGTGRAVLPDYANQWP